MPALPRKYWKTQLAPTLLNADGDHVVYDAQKWTSPKNGLACFKPVRKSCGDQKRGVCQSTAIAIVQELNESRLAELRINTATGKRSPDTYHPIVGSTPRQSGAWLTVRGGAADNFLIPPGSNKIDTKNNTM